MVLESQKPAKNVIVWQKYLVKIIVFIMIVHSESEMFISKTKHKGTFLEQIKRPLRVKNHRIYFVNLKTLN